MYLVDGNNVMGQRVGWHRDKPAARRRLMEELARFARFRRARVSVVFDGAPEPGFPDGAGFRGIKVFYSRRGSDADERIVDLVEAERNRHNLVVVTSDGGLTARVRVSGVRVMRSGELRRMLDGMPADAGEGEAEEVRSEEIQSWLRYFGAEEGDDDDYGEDF